MRRRPLRPSDVARLAAEYDAAPDIADPDTCPPLWMQYSAYALDRQRNLADQFTIYFVSVSDPYGHGSELLSDLVQGRYKVPAPTACPPHPTWDGAAYSASRTWHDIEGHGFTGGGFTLDEEVRTFRQQAEQLRAASLEELICVVFSDTLQQLASTLFNRRFAPQKVVLTEHSKLIERCLDE